MRLRRVGTHVPKTSFRSYLSSTVGVLGFTTSSAFLLSGFFFPPKSGMMTLVVFAFLLFCLFVCLVVQIKSHKHNPLTARAESSLSARSHRSQQQQPGLVCLCLPGA